jgi:hypothetical protein
MLSIRRGEKLSVNYYNCRVLRGGAGKADDWIHGRARAGRNEG